MLKSFTLNTLKSILLMKEMKTFMMKFVSTLAPSWATSSHSQNKTDSQRRFVLKFHAINQKFSRIAYENFFAKKTIREIFRVMEAIGITNDMIEAYPKLKDSKEMYLKISQSIQDFGTSHMLIK